MDPFIIMRNITKSFGGIKALDRVDFDLNRAEVHALVGENGAGKSTLMKILSGVLQPDHGEILINDDPIRLANPSAALKNGIACIFQELSLLDNLSIMENILFSASWQRSPRLDWKTSYQETEQILRRLDLDIDPRICVGELGIAEQQLVEIARALSAGSKIIIMDEPSSCLAPREVNKLFKVIAELVSSGTSVVYISHKMDEIFAIADRISILKDGRKVASRNKTEVNKDEVVELIVGRKLDQVFPRLPEIASREISFALKKYATAELKAIDIELRKGEIFGLAGLEGQGQRELLKSIYCGSRHRGRMEIFGSTVRIDHPKDSLIVGLGMVPGDRKAEGLISDLTIRENITLSKICLPSKIGFIGSQEEKQIVSQYIDELKVKTPSENSPANSLSGGNQQKIVLAKILATDAGILLLEEPTRGVDVGAKFEIYRLVADLAAKGITIILYSTEMMELIGLCHRIGVMYDGGIAQIIEHNDATEETIIRAALGL